MKTLVQRQEECIARMLESRTSDKRAIKNRNAAIGCLRAQCEKLHYFPSEIKQIISDTRYIYELKRGAE